MARKTARSTDSLEIPEEQSSEVIVASGGDVFLEIKDQYTGTEHRYLCSRKPLRKASEYFDVLLDPFKFTEGIALETKLQQLYKRYDGPIPADEIPSVALADVGQLPKTAVSTNLIVRLFLRILHDPATPWPVNRSQSLNLVALLAIVADRFAAHGPVAEYLKKQMLDITLLKDRRSTMAYKTELENRQRLLAGMIFGFSQWVSHSSAALVIEGPEAWTTTNNEYGGEGEKDDDALWWRLPGGVEEEILCRREYVLHTLSSIQKHFIALYSSRQPQCRLGYGSSPNCDSYQLGEIIRFFSRKGLLRVESAFAAVPEEDHHEPYNGSIEEIIAKLKECPSYQIDHNHSHCGLRTRLMPILDSLWPSKSVWICLDCWRTDKGKESWLNNPQGGTWHWRIKPPLRVNSGCSAHRDAKAMYTADIRNWTPV